MVPEGRILDLLAQLHEALEKGVHLRPEDVTDQEVEQAALREQLKRIGKAEALLDLPLEDPLSRPLPLPAVPNHQILACLGQGGMGVVYKAWQENLRRLVALKTTLAGKFAHAIDRQRFRHEAEAVASLDHPNIVKVYEVGECEGLPYFSMQFIEGGRDFQTTAKEQEEMKDARDKWRWAVSILIEVARAVHYAHERGLVHRDLKPTNILLDDKDRPYITDFGLAKRLENAGSFTIIGVILGTPGYMAPEQARGEKAVTASADIYSLGAILYEILTGGKPCWAGNWMDTLVQVGDPNKVPVEPRTINPKIDRDLETVCLKCLSKDQAHRYTSAEALACDLQRWLDGEPVRARAIGWFRKRLNWARRRPWEAAFVGVLLLLSIMSPVLAWKWLEADYEKGLKESALQDAEGKTRQADRAREGTTAFNRFLRKRVLLTPTPLEFGGIKRDATVREMLDAALAHIEEDFHGQPELEAEIRHTLGECYFNMGEYTAASPQLLRAVTLRREVLGNEHDDTLYSMAVLASCYVGQSRLSDAEPLIRHAEKNLSRNRGPQDELTLTVRAYR